MASEVKTDKLSPSTAQALQIGDASDTITIPTGATFTVTDGIGVASGGTGLASFTAGDILYATGTTTLAKLAKGTAEQVLAMNSGATAPDWGSVDLTALPTITVAKGGTNLTSFTAGDILYATGSTTLAKLAKGAATEVIAMNSGATAPEWVAAGSGAWAVLQTQEITSATDDMEFIDGTGGTVLDATYDNYCLILSKVVPVTDNVELLMTISNDTGSSYITSAYKTQAWVVYSGGTYYYANTTGVTGDSTDWSNDSQGTLRVWFQNPAVNQFFQCYHQGTCTNTPDNNSVAWFGVGTYPTAVAGGYDAFRLAFTSGDIATMKATLFGISQ